MGGRDGEVVYVFINTTSLAGKLKNLSIPYSWKLSREKNFRELVEKDFCGENFCLLLPPKDATPPNFVYKTCTNSHKTSKFAIVFSLKSFPLYTL